MRLVTVAFFALAVLAASATKLRHRPAAGAPAGAPGAPAAPTKSPKENLERAEKGLGKLGAYENGYSGKLVTHEDKATMVEDFGKEYGPDGPSSLAKICNANPSSMWCREHGRKFGASMGAGLPLVDSAAHAAKVVVNGPQYPEH